MRKIFGEYSPYGYAIYTADGRELYRAGNSRFNSYDILAPDNKNALNIETIRTYCEWTGREMASEIKGEWLGCWYADNA